ncbi:large subunit GTPase 1 homolog [Tachypleus tridentatus]|uniref:large subunit GTPase 1 homolog n=1 Tax=Tachypleus tridentatus TaxID=6853 RepID=UPI003FCF8A4E
MLEETEHLILTPYEKNLEFWRQLWRVLEKREAWATYFTQIRVKAIFFSALQQSVDEVSDISNGFERSQETETLSYNTTQVHLGYRDATDHAFNSLHINKGQEQLESMSANSGVRDQSINRICDKGQSQNTSEYSEPKHLTTSSLFSREHLITFFKTYHSGKKVKEGATTVGLTLLIDQELIL